MSWMDDDLLYGEEVIYETGLHWSLLLPGSLLIVLGIFNWFLLIPAVVVLPYNLYSFCSRKYIVTNQRLIENKGIYYIRRQEWPHEKIDDVIFTQSLGDRLWGKGNIILLGWSISKSKIEGVGKPAQLRNAIQSQLPTK